MSKEKRKEQRRLLNLKGYAILSGDDDRINRTTDDLQNYCKKINVRNCDLCITCYI